jgi:VWFA-related protein
MRYGIAVFSLVVLVAQETPVISVPVRLVAVPTLVFSKDNRLIPGLKSADFRVLDNGIPQNVSLDTDDPPVSVVVAIQTSVDARPSASYIAKVGSVMEAHLVGATGRAAVIRYADDIKVLKPFGAGDVRWAFRSISVEGTMSRAIDAGIEGIAMLKTRPRTQARVLLFIGQAVDRGSEATWATLQEEADRENVSIYALISAEAKPNPLSALIAATGGAEHHFHRQHELEDAIGTLGVELRSIYMLSYRPSSADAGRHTISVEVSVPGARTYARPGYMLSPN